MNNLTIQGNLVNDVTLGTSQDGKKYCYGKIGVNPGKDKEAMFFEFTVFGYDAETLAMVAKKGDPVIISGRLEENKSEKDGVTYINKKIIGNFAKAIVKRPQESAANNESEEDPFAQFK